MKMKNKLFLGLGILGIAAAGAALSIGGDEIAVVKAADTVSEKWDFTTKATGSTDYKNQWTYNDQVVVKGGANNSAGWAYIRMGGKPSNNPDHVSSLSSVNPSQSDTTSVVATFLNFGNNSAYKISKIGLEVSDTAFEPSTASNYPESSAYDYVAFDSTSLSEFDDYVVTFTPSSVDVWSEGSYFRLTVSFSLTASSNYGADIESVTFYEDAPLVNPESIAVTGDSVIDTIGKKIKLEAAVTPEETTDKTVVWSSSDEKVAIVEEDGTVTAVSFGTAVIRATSSSSPDVYGEIEISVSDSSISAKPYDAYVSAENDDVTIPESGGYTDELNNFCTSDTGLLVAYSSALKSTYKETGAKQFQLKASVGWIGNMNNLGNIKSVRVIPTAGATMRDYTLVAKTSFFDAGIALEPTDDNFFVFPADADYSYFRIVAGSQPTYLGAFFVEFGDTDVESAREWAIDFLNKITPECEDLNVLEGTWNGLAASFKGLSNAAQDAIRNESHVDLLLTDIQKALEKYRYIVIKYGYENFINIDFSSYITPLSMTENTNGTLYIVLGASLGIVALAIGAAVVLKKRHAVSK